MAGSLGIAGGGQEDEEVSSTPVKSYKKPKSALHTLALLKMSKFHLDNLINLTIIRGNMQRSH